jgi:hypothetical protein
MPCRHPACARGRMIASSLAVALALLAFAVVSQAQVTFSKQTYQTGVNPVSVFSDDFNGDGRKDVESSASDALIATRPRFVTLNKLGHGNSGHGRKKSRQKFRFSPRWGDRPTQSGGGDPFPRHREYERVSANDP